MLTFRSVIVHAFAHCCNTDFYCDFFRKKNEDASCTVSLKKFLFFLLFHTIFLKSYQCIWSFVYNNHYSGIILPICGVPAETCSFLVFPLLVRLSCVTVYGRGCPAVHGGVWLGSRFLRALGRHPLWLPARLMSPCLVLGVILNCCGTEFPMSLRV